MFARRPAESCQGWGRGFESLRPLQILSRTLESYERAARAARVVFALGVPRRDLEARTQAQEPLPSFVRATLYHGSTVIAAEREVPAIKAVDLLLEKPMDKFDLKRSSRALYSAPVGEFAVIEVPPLSYLMIDGAGDPNIRPAYASAVEALYAVAYTLKFLSKDVLKRDYVVPPLEGLWWACDMTDFVARRKDRWCWTMMIAVPDFVDRSMVERAIAQAIEKRRLPAPSRLRFEPLEEGRAVQTMHIGAYDDEGPILERLHMEFFPAHGLVEAGHHHEIYLGDHRKTPASKLRTILRQPVRPAV